MKENKFSELNRVYWIAGTACAGKTTISDIIARRYDWNVYHIDEHEKNLRERACPEKHPMFYQLSQITGDDLWLRPLEEQIKTQPLYITDSFPLLIEDLKNRLASDSRNLIVDASVLPDKVIPFLASLNHIFYLIPQEEFQRTNYALRPWIKEVLAKTSDPELAWSNWMARDIGYARWIEKEVDKYGLKRILVDGLISIEETVEMVVRYFGI